MSDSAYGKKVREVLRKNLHPDSHDWLIACLDPYHDDQYEVDGLCDERVTPSIVQIHNQTYTLTAPDSAAANWDASVIFTGFNTPIDWPGGGGMMTNCTGHEPVAHYYDSSARSTGQPFGALDIWAGDTGSTWPTGAPNTLNDLHYSLGSVNTDSKCRLIGVGFEIINTTAEVYKQGSLTVGMLPAVSDDHYNIKYYDTKGTAPTEGTFFVQADKGVIRSSTVDPLIAVPGSTTWPASKGLYAIPRMTRVPHDTYSYDYVRSEIGLKGTNTRIPVFRGTDNQVAVPEPCGYALAGPNSDQKSPVWKPAAPNGFSPIQCFLTGLSHETTLTIRFRTIVEYFPGLDSTLLPLASPSPQYDPRTIALYCATAALAPYGVPVNQNAAGDYFRRILSILGTGMGLVSPMFGEFAPIAAAVGTLSTHIAKAIPVSKKEAGVSAMQSGARRRKRPISLKQL